MKRHNRIGRKTGIVTDGTTVETVAPYLLTGKKLKTTITLPVNSRSGMTTVKIQDNGLKYPQALKESMNESREYLKRIIDGETKYYNSKLK